jgi:hypothetical protein
MAFSPQLQPNLADAIDREVLAMNPLDLIAQPIIAPIPLGPESRIGLARRMLPVGRRGNRQYLADRLDPVLRAMLVDKGFHGLNRRSSSAAAK